ncbi:hypothetical protein EGW08_015699 [Elysia chlorotica]|uniref:Uncharacterized protein n=1 Tax=Elysia chlorotica TaxID=188477 RepID=A0A433T4T1_ELYCH|nr:hypothetical protein EGW08_015699 [Elysia chlorotica]
MNTTVRHSVHHGLSSTLPHFQQRILHHQQQQQQKLLQKPQQQCCASHNSNNDRSNSSSSSSGRSSVGSGGGTGCGHIIGFNSVFPQPFPQTLQRCYSHHHIPKLLPSCYQQQQQQQQQHGGTLKHRQRHDSCSSPSHLQPPLLAAQYAAPLMHFIQPASGSRGVTLKRHRSYHGPSSLVNKLRQGKGLRRPSAGTYTHVRMNSLIRSL